MGSGWLGRHYILAGGSGPAKGCRAWFGGGGQGVKMPSGIKGELLEKQGAGGDVSGQVGPEDTGGDSVLLCLLLLFGLLV